MLNLSAPSLDWRVMKRSDHFVQFYEDDRALVDSVAGFVGAGLELGENCIVVATPAHQEAIDVCLALRGLDLAALRARQQYVTLDADETLSRIRETVGRVVSCSAEDGTPVRVFG